MTRRLAWFPPSQAAVLDRHYLVMRVVVGDDSAKLGVFIAQLLDPALQLPQRVIVGALAKKETARGAGEPDDADAEYSHDSADPTLNKCG